MESSYVYLMTRPEHYKIGYSRDPFVRRTAIKGLTKKSYTLRAMVPGDRSVERRVLNLFKYHRIKGEFFYPLPKILNWFLLHPDYVDPGIPYHPIWEPAREIQMMRAKYQMGIDVEIPGHVRDQVIKAKGNARRSED